jgi:hypothetical protein
MVILNELKDSTPENLATILTYIDPKNPPVVIGQALKTLYSRAHHLRPLVIRGVEHLLTSSNKEAVIVGLWLVGELMIKPYDSYLFQRIDNESDHEIKSIPLRSLSVLNPEVAIDYFSYFLTSRQESSAFYAQAFIKLDVDMRQQIISVIMKNPVEAIDHAIYNLIPHASKIKPELEILYASIAQKFQRT